MDAVSYTLVMDSEPRLRSMTNVESLFAADVPVEERQQALVGIYREDRPDNDTIAVVITLLHDPDDNLRSMAEQMLCRWGQPAVTMLLNALRSTQPTDVPYRLAIIAQLSRLGPNAARAETLLRSLMQDPDIGEAADKALRAIRMDGDDLVRRFAYWGVDLLLLIAVVAGPMIAIRLAAPKQPMPPLGLSVGIASLVIVGLMLARITFAADLLPGDENTEVGRPGRWNIYVVMAVGGAFIGAALGGLCLACGGWAQNLFK